MSNTNENKRSTAVTSDHPPPTLDELYRVDGQIYGTLTRRERTVIDHFRDFGSQYGVAVSIESTASNEEIAAAKSRAKKRALYRRKTSLVQVKRIGADMIDRASFIVGETYSIEIKDWETPLGDVVRGKTYSVEILAAVTPGNTISYDGETPLPVTPGVADALNDSFLRVRNLETDKARFISLSSIRRYRRLNYGEGRVNPSIRPVKITHRRNDD